MTSGVYPRKPGNKSGKKPMFAASQIDAIKAGKSIGHSVKYLSALWLAGEKTISRVLHGTGAYKVIK